MKKITIPWDNKSLSRWWELRKEEEKILKNYGTIRESLDEYDFSLFSIEDMQKLKTIWLEDKKILQKQINNYELSLGPNVKLLSSSYR